MGEAIFMPAGMARGGYVTVNSLGEIEHRFKSGGSVSYPRDLNQSDKEFGPNLRILLIMAKQYGDRYRLRPISHVENEPNPDADNLRTGRLVEVKNTTSQNLDNALQNALKKAHKQTAEEVVVAIKKPYSLRAELSALTKAFMNGRHQNIKRLSLLYADGTMREYDELKISRRFRRINDEARQ